MVSEEALESKKSAAFQPRHRLAIYVWELQPHLSLQSLIDSEQWNNWFPGKASSFSEFAFLHTIMDDAATRVRTPWEANLFLFPTFSIGVAAGFGGDLILGRIKRLIGWAKTNPTAAPLWARNGGADE